MITKEEFQRDLIRMFDSLRNECKGEKNCEGINCRDCPFDRKVCNADIETFHAHEAIEIVENWAEQHPIATNADKFREVFGFEPTPIYCVNNNMKCSDCEYFDYNNGLCDVSIFWDAEYKPTKEGEE